jgi:uncharacterized membrane protein YfcA
MEQGEQLWIMVAAIAGGLLGARLARITPWKGALMIVVGLVVVVAVHDGEELAAAENALLS